MVIHITDWEVFSVLWTYFEVIQSDHFIVLRVRVVMPVNVFVVINVMTKVCHRLPRQRLQLYFIQL